MIFNKYKKGLTNFGWIGKLAKGFVVTCMQRRDTKEAEAAHKYPCTEFLSNSHWFILSWTFYTI